MGKIVASIMDFFKNILLFHKLKILMVFVFFFLFAFLLFPTGDLTDLLTVKASEATQNQVYLQADDLSLTAVPAPGLQLTRVLVQAMKLPSISAESLRISPQIIALLSKALGLSSDNAIGFSAAAEGIFKGRISVDYGFGDKGKSGERQQKIDLQADDLALNALGGFLRDLNLGDWGLEGSLSLQSKIAADPKFEEQPNGQITVNIKNFDLPSRIADFGMGPLNLPELKLKKISLNGNLSEGRMNLKEVILGDDKDEIHGNIKGDVVVSVKGQGTPASFDLGGYNLDVDLSVSGDFQNRAKLFLLVLDNYKTPQGDGSHYKFHVSAANFSTPPKITNL